MRFENLIATIEDHHARYPTHGTDCACLDWAIQAMRKHTTTRSPEAQQRIDHIIRKAIENRPVIHKE